MLVGARRWQRAGRSAAVLLLLCLCNACVTATAGNAVAVPAVVMEYELDLTRRVAVQRIDAGDAVLRSMKFVQIEVTQVINPRRLPLSFTVDFQPAQGERFYLGTFSLFPPDNPGKFIVATQGKLQPGGAVIVTLVPLARVDEHAEVRVMIHGIRLR